MVCETCGKRPTETGRSEMEGFVRHTVAQVSISFSPFLRLQMQNLHSGILKAAHLIRLDYKMTKKRFLGVTF